MVALIFCSLNFNMLGPKSHRVEILLAADINSATSLRDESVAHHRDGLHGALLVFVLEL